MKHVLLLLGLGLSLSLSFLGISSASAAGYDLNKNRAWLGDYSFDLPLQVHGLRESDAGGDGSWEEGDQEGERENEALEPQTGVSSSKEEEPLDPVRTRLLDEVQRYYRGIDKEPNPAELKAGVEGASQMLLADVSLDELSTAIERAIEWAVGQTSPVAPWLFEVVVPTHVPRPPPQEPTTSDVSPGAVQPGAVNGDRNRTQRIGTGLMISAFVAQGFSLAATIVTVVEPTVLNEAGPGLWVIQASSIPFAPLGVTGFALRFGGESRSKRLSWTGVGLLQAAAYSGFIGGFSIAGAFSDDMGEAGLILIPGILGHVGTSIALAISGGICLGIGKRREAEERMSDSGDLEQHSSKGVWMVPTVAPQPKGFVLGLVGFF